MGIESATSQHRMLVVFPLKGGRAEDMPTTVGISASISGWFSVVIDTIKVCVSGKRFLFRWQGMPWGDEQHAIAIESSVIAGSGKSMDFEAQQQRVRPSHGSMTMAAAPTISRQKNTTKNHTVIFLYFEFITSSLKDSIMEDVTPLCELVNRHVNFK